MTATFFINKLFDYYNVYTISGLADKIGIKQPIISGWKLRNSINPIKKKCRELGIYKEIFTDGVNETEHPLEELDDFTIALVKRLIQKLGSEEAFEKKLAEMLANL